MKACFAIENPKEIECTLKITMSMKEWETLQDQLETKWPSWCLSQAITHMVQEVKKVYYAPDQDA